MTPIKIIILGAGYAGLTASLQLQKQSLGDQVEVTLINKNHYHYQTIWLHRNAVGVNTKEQTAFDLREILDLERIRFIKDKVTAIDCDQQVITTSNGEYPYDYLIIGLGSEIDSFQIPGLKEHAYSITSLSRSTRLFDQIMASLLQYSQTTMETPFHLIVGGGGFTGVELLGELTERLPELCSEMGISPSQIKLKSIEYEPTVLPEFDLELGEYAMQQLEKRHVEFYLGTKIRSVSKTSIKIERSGLVEDIPVDLFVWTAGVKGHHLIDQMNIPSELGRVEVEADLTAPGYPNIFIIGDVALIRNQEGKPYLPNADIAIQKAKVAVHNLLVKLNQKGQSQSFIFKNRGTIASIGSKDAIGVTGKGRRIFGRLASILKKISDYVFLFQMGGFKLIWYQFIKQKNKK
ncbi:NAD(P)/FAD-dependent oxidoreductase [Amphibacillus sp. MSJ-3]|uniref:NAD(P)/FAD-dependent oxidoreductase n=1 Tax=Amphibacillus sp. MSJ-3 TaxID=2841505 RepID=UPI001C0ED077|nr:NAD(P)/FAD-dependent oxidoreductase [Amphibacillus sp. MSJ-3]MBU5595661.1 NAD(P)/FAD-dependent oxidoreductase [Amphibacillus sp. MSJ-3]